MHDTLILDHDPRPIPIGFNSITQASGVPKCCTSLDTPSATQTPREHGVCPSPRQAPKCRGLTFYFLKKLGLDTSKT